MAAYRRVYDSCRLQADCREPGPAAEPYARQSSTTGSTFTFFYLCRRSSVSSLLSVGVLRAVWQFLSSCDYVVYTPGGGRAPECGSHDQLMEMTGGDYATVITSTLQQQQQQQQRRQRRDKRATAMPSAGRRPHLTAIRTVLFSSVL